MDTSSETANSPFSPSSAPSPTGAPSPRPTSPPPPMSENKQLSKPSRGMGKKYNGCLQIGIMGHGCVCRLIEYMKNINEYNMGLDRNLFHTMLKGLKGCATITEMEGAVVRLHYSPHILLLDVSANELALQFDRPPALIVETLVKTAMKIEDKHDVGHIILLFPLPDPSLGGAENTDPNIYKQRLEEFKVHLRHRVKKHPNISLWEHKMAENFDRYICKDRGHLSDEGALEYANSIRNAIMQIGVKALLPDVPVINLEPLCPVSPSSSTTSMSSVRSRSRSPGSAQTPLNTLKKSRSRGKNKGNPRVVRTPKK